eukprot:579489_1
MALNNIARQIAIVDRSSSVYSFLDYHLISDCQPQNQPIHCFQQNHHQTVQMSTPVIWTQNWSEFERDNVCNKMAYICDRLEKQCYTKSHETHGNVTHCIDGFYMQHDLDLDSQY